MGLTLAVPWGREGMMRPFSTMLWFGLLVAPLHGADPPDEPSAQPIGTIAFASLGPRGWDVYVQPVDGKSPPRRLIDHKALDFNAALSPDGRQAALVSQRDGNLEIYTVDMDGSSLERLTDEFSLDDAPRWSPDGKQIAFVSTRQAATNAGQAWNAVYVMNSDGTGVRRVTPEGTTDYSPSWSPQGDLIAVASGGGQAGGTDLYVMKTDGSERRRVERNGGWPSFSADGQSLYFHSRRQNRWSVWRVNLDGADLQRMTPREVDAYTPQASADGKSLVVAVKRGNVRQIELVDLTTGKLTPLTSDAVDHWNPSIAADGTQVVYHQVTPGTAPPNIEPWGEPPGTNLRILRLGGSFPAFAPDGQRLALLADGFAALDVMNIDGSSRKSLYTGTNRGMFSTSWAHEGDLIAFAVGGVFERATTDVELFAIHPDGSGLQKLTEHTANNGFPAFSPDGKQLVFRSGREGFKNLFIMNSDGTNVRQLTKGNWTDTMCDWSGDGKWIVFASDRQGEFDIWLIKPDGSELHPLIGGGGRDNHPHFSPDCQWIVFTSMRAGYSAEEISLPSQPQPYGELFCIRPDGTGLLRLTHNGFEDGTPAWGKSVETDPKLLPRR